jgi:acetyl esterase/lipase
VYGNLNKLFLLKSLKFLLVILSFLTFIIGIYFTIVLFIPLQDGISSSLSYFIAQISGFLMFLYLTTTILLVKLIPKIKRRSLVKKCILVFGLVLTFLNALPLIATPISIQTAENEFNVAYGENWRAQIPSTVDSFFLPTQFNLYNYFLGFSHRDCNVETDVKYYDNDGFQLYFDVYYPKSTTTQLPGNNSVIIKIHGGSWQFGDKSLGNVLVLNKYLAAQGYVVFDIQYGLLDAGGSSFIPTPDHVRGNLTLHDMVYQIGNFTKQLETTFASTGVIGLGYNDPYFAGNFSNALNIKGIIPIYPPNFADPYFTREPLSRLIPGDPISNPLAFEKFTPSNLADATDPPAIIFQGLRDDLVPLINAETIKSALNANGIDCMLLTFPFAAHASDLIVGNTFSQVWVYYLERFLYLEQ